MKTCNKCHEEKPDDGFYKAAARCKECCKRESRERYHRLAQDPEWMEQEKIRTREKYHRLEYGKKKTRKRSRAVAKRYQQKYPEKRKAVIASQRITVPENHSRHHWSYNEQHWKDIIPLPIAKHSRLHCYLVYDLQTKFYRDIYGNLLDTREKHEQYISEIFSKRIAA